MKRHRVMQHLSLPLLAGALALSYGCGLSGGPVAPVGGAAPVEMQTRVIDAGDPPSTETGWTMVGSRWVDPGVTTEVKGSRYTLTFSDKSVAKPTLVTIHELDSGVVDVEFGPDGTTFDADVVLEIDYRGTSSDPLAADFHGARPALFYHNPETKAWEEIPTKVDPETHKLVAVLHHFSRYAMYQPSNTKEGEWQWTQSGPPPLRGGETVTR